MLLYFVASLAWLGCLSFAYGETSEGDAIRPVEAAPEAALETKADDAAVAEPTPTAPEVIVPEVVAEADEEEHEFRRIGPVTTITEVSSGLHFPARVDTGATTCSIHYEAIEIEDAAENPQDNVGKRVRVLIQNPNGDKQWVSTKIVELVMVRTSTNDEERYKVPLKLRWQDVEKKVMVTLKDREKMKYPLLLGRNFLRGDFVVDVNLDGE